MNVQILIDIDENEYLGIKNHPDNITSYPVTIHLYEAVRNGQSLPKGHGDLIDKSELEPDADYDDGLYYAYSRRQIDDAPIIVEAESEVQE